MPLWALRTRLSVCVGFVSHSRRPVETQYLASLRESLQIRDMRPHPPRLALFRTTGSRHAGRAVPAIHLRHATSAFPRYLIPPMFGFVSHDRRLVETQHLASLRKPLRVHDIRHRASPLALFRTTGSSLPRSQHWLCLTRLLLPNPQSTICNRRPPAGLASFRTTDPAGLDIQPYSCWNSGNSRLRHPCVSPSRPGDNAVWFRRAYGVVGLSSHRSQETQVSRSVVSIQLCEHPTTTQIDCQVKSGSPAGSSCTMSGASL